MEPLDISQPIVIYGAGNCGRAMQREATQRGYRVLCFLDQNFRGEVDGLPCYAPDGDNAAAVRDAGAILVLGLWNYAVDISKLQHEYSARGWQSVVSYPQWIEWFGPCIEPYWLAPRELYEDNAIQRRIEKVATLWADHKSRDLFERAIKARLGGELEYLNAPVRESQSTQYFSPQIPGWPASTRFVDCGAFDGDTLRELPNNVEAIAAFEPDLKNFQALSRSSRERQPKTEVLLWPCGVGKETASLSFCSDSGAASQFRSGGQTSVPVVALDDTLQNFAPDFIKMDIEGAEYEALEGARGLIQEYHPALAICVYHRPDDLWRIPLLLQSWDCGYKLYLRPHGFNGFDWVLYAQPT